MTADYAENAEMKRRRRGRMEGRRVVMGRLEGWKNGRLGPPYVVVKAIYVTAGPYTGPSVWVE